MMTRDVIFEKVKGVLINVLGVGEDEIKEGSTLVANLGAEDMDFLDLQFELGKAFQIKINRGELFPDEVMPTHIGAPDATKIAATFTVKSLVDFVATKLAA